MNFTKQNWLSSILACFMGIILGAVIAFFITDSVREKTFKIYIEHSLLWEENEAVSQFKKNSPQVALYAQERLISFSNSLKEINFLDETIYLKVVGFAEARKGFLYEKIGDINKSEEHFGKAMAALKRANIIINKDDLKSLLIASKTSKNE